MGYLFITPYALIALLLIAVFCWARLVLEKVELRRCLTVVAWSGRLPPRDEGELVWIGIR